MKKLYLLSTILLMAFVIIYSCSTEEEDTTPPPSVVATPEPEPPAPTQYTLTVTAGEGGTVSTDGGTYDEGTSVTITATPNEGYEFVGWTGAIESSELVIQILVSEAKEVNAGFSFICLTTELENYFLPSYDTFKIRHPKDITQVNTSVNDYLHRYGTEKISLDYNKDGFMDFVAFENDYNTENNRQLIKFYLGDCEGNLTLDELNSNKFEGLVHGRKILLGDYNNDTYPDLFLIGHGWDKPPFPGEYPVILFSSESGVFTENRLTQFDGFFHGGASGDFDNDGDLDIILTTINQGKNAFTYLKNNGNGVFIEEEDVGPFKSSFIPEINQNEVAFLNCEMYDINKDGYLDVLFLSQYEGDKIIYGGLKSTYYSPIILFGNGIDFYGELITLPLVEDWSMTYDVDFYDLNEDGNEEIILNRVRDSFEGWYIQILEKDGEGYKDSTAKFIDVNFSETGFWNVWLEIRDYDNDGVIEMRNNIPKALDNDERFKLQEWELINGKFIKVEF
jgi:hypothetical protein